MSKLCTRSGAVVQPVAASAVTGTGCPRSLRSDLSLGRSGARSVHPTSQQDSDMAYYRPAVLLLALLCLAERSNGAQQYLGKFLGKLSELHHGVSGEVYAVDARTLHLKDFTYDGEGPAAYFWAGTTRSPGAAGFRVPDENGSGAVLKRYRRKSLTITLPDGKTLNNIKWFSVWCEEFAVNFGDVKIPRNFDYPKPQKIGTLQGVHGVSSDNVVLVDAQTLLIPNFSYDGEAPDAKFWVGTGSKPSPQGLRIPDENGKTNPLRRYDRKTVVLTLPGDLTVFDIGHFGVWCEAFTVDFGHVLIPQQLNVPPSLKMLGVSPQSKLNCEVLYDDLAFEVRWAVAGESIVLQLVAKLEDGEYMSFGLSGDDSKNQMIGGDVVVAWVDRSTLKGYAQDYYLEAKSQCSGPSGSCPDERLADNTNNIRLLNAAMVNGYSIVTYQRPLRASDELDRPIYTNRSQAVIWAVGPLNQRQEVSFHSTFSKKNTLLDFGRPSKWNCPMPELDSSSQQSIQTSQTRRRPETTTEEVKEVSTTEVTRSRGSDRRRGGNRGTTERSRNDDRTASRRRGSSATTTVAIPTPKPVSNRNAWFIPPIECYEPDDGVFYAQMGPTGGKHGYPAITGHVGWGISWYINGLLIPVINVVRGKTYTFVTEGGEDPDIPAKYHPFYITDDSIGGYEYKTPEERQNVRIFAGVKTAKDGKVYPIGTGRLCHWTHKGDKDADDYPSFGAFQRDLELRCDVGDPGAFQWTPDANTPDTVYYQCFTHRYLGWKINVLDSCEEPAASNPEPVLALPEHGDLKSDSSIIVETRVKPNDLFQTTHTKPDHGRPDHDLEEDVGPDSKFQSSPEILYVPATSYHNDPFYTTSTNPTFSITQTPKFISSTTITTPSTTKSTTVVTASPVRKPPQFQEQRPQKPMPLKPFSPKPLPFYMRRPMPVMPYRPPFYKPMMRPPPPYFGPYKKAYHRIPMRKRPIRIFPQKVELKNNTRNIENVSTSTEKNNNTEMFSSELIYVNKVKETGMKPAINTGFHPESVVIEGGFKPIIKQEIQDRILEPEVELEEDIGVIDVSKNSEPIQPFEPMFIPSPPDSLQKKNISKIKPTLKKKPNLMFIVKHVARSADFEDQNDDSDDEIAMAQERVETYYLPPDNKKIKPVERVRKPSNIDIPPGSVVTFDGKTVSGISLTTPLEPSYESRSSKISEFLRLSPQFGPFKGEIPPLETKNINLAGLPQLNSQAVLNRDLNAPAIPSNPQTTRLSPVRSK